MNRFWSKLAGTLVPYVPGEQPKDGIEIKLNTNENPYGPSPLVRQALNTTDTIVLKQYPDPEATDLRIAIANVYGVNPNQIFVGNGSDEVLAHAFLAFFDKERPILFPDITYAFYQVLCDLYQIPYQIAPLTNDFDIEVSQYLGSSGGIVIANPNAPTGISLALSEIRRVLESQPDRVVIVDEAYVDFGAETAVKLVAEYPNLLVVQTFSKSRSLAGLRVGMAIGSENLIGGLRCIKNSFNPYPLGTLEQRLAIATLADNPHFETCTQAIMRDRDWLLGQLVTAGYRVLPSRTNFLFAACPGLSGESLAAALRTRGTLVRFWKQPRINEFVRISIGTEAECAAVSRQLQEIIQQTREKVMK